MAHLHTAVDAFGPSLVAVSPVYETAPWGPVPQPDYLNAVLIAADNGATARDWLDRARQAESAAQRSRELRWGPRTLDVDVITVDEEISADAELTLPHPRAAHRAFVLVPWLAVQPDARLGRQLVSSLIDALAPDEIAGVRPRPDLELS